MRILMVTQFYPPTVGGQERVVEDLGTELASRGHEVAVATLQQEGLPASGVASGVRVHPIATTTARFFRGYVDPSRRHAPPVVDPKAAAELRRIVRLENPDIVHGHDWLVRSFLPLKRRHGPGLVVTLHDHSLVCANKRLIRNNRACTGPGAAKCLRCSASYYGAAKGPPIAASNWVMGATERALVDMFLPVSQAVADASRLRDRGAPHRVISNFLPTRATPATGQRLPGLPDDYILFAGDVSHDKGAGVLLEAHRQLPSPPPLVLMGRVINPRMLEPFVGAERASSPVLLAAPFGSVRAVGAQPHEVVLDALQRCTVAVVPSVMPEGFGLVALEAMSAGCAVIASNIGGLSDIVSDGENGVLVEPGDVEALRAALAEVLDSAPLRARLGTAAQDRVRDFAAERIVPQVEQAYEDVVAARRRRTAGASRVRLPGGQRTAGELGRIGRWLRRCGGGTVRALALFGDRLRQGAFRIRRRLACFYAELHALRRRRLTAARLTQDLRRVWKGLQRREPRVILALVALGVAGTTIPAGEWSPLRTIFVLPLVLFVPGYALTGAIFRHRAPAPVERMVLALSLSVVTTALVSLFLFLTPWRLTIHSWAIALALFTVGAAVASSSGPTHEPSQPPATIVHRLSLRSPRGRVPITIAVVTAVLVAAAVVLARTPLPSDSAPGYTALWLTRAPGSAKLILGVRSEEHRRTRYVLRLVVGGRKARRHLALEPGETWQVSLPPARRAAASLYRLGHPGVYRSVHIAAPSTTHR